MTTNLSPSLFRGNITEDTQVTFPSGSLVEEEVEVIDIAVLSDGKKALLLNKTPFHPIDSDWPDQPGDKGVITAYPTRYMVIDCRMLAIHKQTQEVRESKDVPRNEKEQWFYVVAHIVNNLEPLVNTTVIAKVNSIYRKNLSLHHTASHLAACAFNLATKDYWEKEAPRKDCFGFPNTDQLAIDSSSIFTNHSAENYHFGLSIKEEGLQIDDLFNNLTEIENTINSCLAEWIATNAPIQMTAPSSDLSAQRTWNCMLPIGLATIPCGGTHLTSLKEIGSINYTITNISSEGFEKRFTAVIWAT